MTMKNKIICAIKNNILDFRQSSDSLWWDYSRVFFEIGRETKFKRVDKIVVKRNWWQGQTEKTVPVGERDGYSYYVSYGDERFGISEEEYQDVVNHREKRIKEAKERHLDKLCGENG